MLGGFSFSLETLDGRIVGRSYVRVRSSRRRTIFENTVKSPGFKRYALAEYEGRHLRYVQLETIQKAGRKKWTDRIWIRSHRGGWALFRSKLGESWSHFFKNGNNLTLLGTHLVFPFFPLRPRGKRHSWIEHVAYNMDDHRIEQLTVRRADKRSHFDTADIRVNREDLSGHVEWDDLGPRTITFPKLELRIRRFADSIPFVAHIRKIKEPKRTLRYRSDDPVGKERNLSFRSKDGTRLWGTLEVPKGGTKLPTAILLHGSGQETRDSGSGFEERDLNVIQARPFRELSRKLIRHGIGVFRYDKRGVGKSGGNWKEVSRTNLLEDVIAATECVADRMKGKPVILVGFSEGANLAISAALKSRQIRGVVLAGARAHSLDRVILNKTLFKARRMKRPGAETRSEIARLRRIFQYVRSLHSKTGGKIKNVPWMGKSLALWSEQISNVPALEAKNLRIPVLLLHGEEDAEILVEECAAMAASLSKSHVPYEVHRFKGLNHFFTKACRDFPGFEYDVPYEMSDEIPDRIATWLRKISK